MLLPYKSNISQLHSLWYLQLDHLQNMNSIFCSILNIIFCLKKSWLTFCIEDSLELLAENSKDFFCNLLACSAMMSSRGRSPFAWKKSCWKLWCHVWTIDLKHGIRLHFNEITSDCLLVLLDYLRSRFQTNTIDQDRQTRSGQLWLSTIKL